MDYGGLVLSDLYKFRNLCGGTYRYHLYEVKIIWTCTLRGKDF